MRRERGRISAEIDRAGCDLRRQCHAIGDYIGESTRAEIAYARSLGKPVRFTHAEVDPDA
ncbi:hypothetical protein [Streptomyces sp. NPDC023838]|uniref:hypothetical protein n=1 Tax=Streptomyces sp. NPDC023838 TaxID=3154325 RepID=UPI0033CCDD10